LDGLPINPHRSESPEKATQKRVIQKHSNHNESARNNMTIMNMKRSLLLITIIFGVTTPGLRGQ
jgi:hypothetical protein